MAAKDKATLKADNITTYPSGTGNILAVDDRAYNVDIIDSSLNTQETADQGLMGNLNLQGNDLLNAGNIVQEYDGYETQANILLMNPASFLNQVWWATDTKFAFKSVIAIIAGANVWQQLGNIYNATTDTYTLPLTVDGHRLDQGEELFFKSVNDSSDTATVLNPKIWKSIGSKPGDEEFKLVSVVSASDVNQGDLLGINTTNAGLGDKPKMVYIGDINDMDTSAWSINQTLFVGDDGLLINILPSINAIAVAVVTKVDATAGSIFVNTLNTTRVSIGLTPAGFTRTNFTADTVVLDLVTYFVAEQTTRGSTSLATQTVICNDDQTVAVAQDHITIAALENFTFDPATQQGIMQVSIDNANAEEQLFIEIYLADGDGVVLDSGSGLPDGDLGVPPIVVMQSAILDMDAADTFFQFISGFTAIPVTVFVGQRLRFHTLAKKVGIAGGLKTFTFSYGVDAFTFIDNPSAINVSMQDAYKVRELIITDTIREAVKIRRGSVSDNDNVLEIENGSASITFAVTGAGDVSSSGTISSPNYSIPFNGDATFNTVSGDGSGLTGISISLQNAYDIDKNILTSAPNGPLDIRVGSGSDGDPILRGFTNGVVQKFSLTGEGNINANAIHVEEVISQDTGNNSFSSLIVQNTAGTEVISGKGNGDFTAIEFLGAGGNLTGIPYTTVENAGSSVAKRGTLNFFNATSIVDNAGNDSTDITLPSGGGGLPVFTQWWHQSRNATQTLNVSVSTIILPNIATDSSIGSDFNPTTGILTVGSGRAGKWRMKLQCNCLINGTNVPPVLEMRIFRNSTQLTSKRYPFGTGATVGNFAVEVDITMQMEVGETARIEIFNETGQTVSVQGSGMVYNVIYEGI